MAEIINLRQARKVQARSEKATEAAGNRARHGRTPAERERDQREAERLRRALDGAQKQEP